MWWEILTSCSIVILHCAICSELTFENFLQMRRHNAICVKMRCTRYLSYSDVSRTNVIWFLTNWYDIVSRTNVVSLTGESNIPQRDMCPNAVHEVSELIWCLTNERHTISHELMWYSLTNSYGFSHWQIQYPTIESNFISRRDGRQNAVHEVSELIECLTNERHMISHELMWYSLTNSYGFSHWRIQYRNIESNFISRRDGRQNAVCEAFELFQCLTN